MLIEIIIIFYFFNIIISRNQNAKKKFFLIIKIKRIEEIVNVNDNEENFNKEISLYNDKHDDSIDLDRVDQPK